MKKEQKIGISIGCFVILAVIIITAVINTITNKKPQDLNVYLNEEVCFSDNVYIKVNKMAVYENDKVGQADDDNDELSKYILHLNICIQRRSNKTKNKPIAIKTNMFQLKSVNLKSKSKMSVFFESMFKATLSALVSGAIEGEISIIDESIEFAQEYIQGSIENAENSKKDFKPIKANNDSFDDFYLDNQSETMSVNLYFPVKQEYLESENVIVLAIDTWHNWEKRIFLITRPS